MLRTMKIDELIRQLENIKINDDQLVDINLLAEKIKRKEDVIRYILDTLTKTTNEFNSIIYINNGVVKYFSPSIDNPGGKNVIMNGNKAYHWFKYEVKNNYTIIVYVIREYTVSRYILHFLDILPETPITEYVHPMYRKLYSYLEQGYKIIFSEDLGEEAEKLKVFISLFPKNRRGRGLKGDDKANGNPRPSRAGRSSIIKEIINMLGGIYENG